MNAALTLVNDTVMIDEEMQSDAAEIVREARDLPLEGISIMVDGKTIAVPDGLTSLLLHVVEHAAEGGVLTVRTMPEELTTTVAADLLGVSRPTLMKMIANDDIAARDVGSHKRLRAHDVLTLKAKRLAAQQQSFHDLRALNV